MRQVKDIIEKMRAEIRFFTNNNSLPSHFTEKFRNEENERHYKEGRFSALNEAMAIINYLVNRAMTNKLPEVGKRYKATWAPFGEVKIIYISKDNKEICFEGQGGLTVSLVSSFVESFEELPLGGIELLEDNND